jgi:hypothetical protein
LPRDGTFVSREKRSFMTGHEVLAITIAAPIVWGFAMAALVLDRKPLRQGLGRQSPAVNIREVFAYGVGRRDSLRAGALVVGRVRALGDATELRLRSATRSSGG